MTATAELLTRELAAAAGVRSVLVLETSPTAPTVIWPCSRCWDEDGTIATYAHVLGGVCFKCRGRGGVSMTRADAEAKAKKLIKSRLAAARAAAREAHIATLPVLAALLDEAETGHYVRAGLDGPLDDELDAELVAPLGTFVATMAFTFRARPEKFTDRMAAAAAKAIEEGRCRRAARAAERAAATPAPEGRVVVTGEILTTKLVDHAYGSTFKMTVKSDAGWRVFAAVPAAIRDQAEPGVRVEFTATLERAADDELMAWGSRPTKARIL